MRWFLCAVCLVAAGFLLGRATGSETASASPAGRTVALHEGDTARFPAAATRCTASQEGGAANVICSHSPRPRFGVVFYADNLLVFRNGSPDDPVFSARGRP